VLDQATLKAAQEEAPLPGEIRAFLGRLLLGRQPFATVEAFSAELERVLYDGEYSPTTFNMAFFMHTLFREENDRDVTGMKVEQGDNYLAYTAAGETMRSGAVRVDQGGGQANAQGSQKNSTLLIGGGLVAVVILGLGYMFLGRPKMDPAIQAQLLEFKRIKAEMEQQKADLDAKAKAESEKTALLQKQLSESKSVEDKAKIQKKIEENQQAKLELERQQKAAEQRLAEQKQNEQRLADQKKASETKAAAIPAPPVQDVPKPLPMQEAAKSAAVPTPAQQSAAPVNEPAHVVNKTAPAYPVRAIQMRWGTNQDQKVRLKVFVGEQGQALKVSVIEGVSGPYGFDDAAIEAANKSTYSPATRDGKPVRGWTTEIAYIFPKR
jgi:TonB family protein